MGTSTPKTLIDRINHHKGISQQFKNFSDRLIKVVYPTSGDIMRAARMPASLAIVNSTLYWFVTEDSDEAAFLVGILNASILTRAFAEARTSGRHFQKSPWRKIPIPAFNKVNSEHKGIVDVTHRAER